MVIVAATSYNDLHRLRSALGLSHDHMQGILYAGTPLPRELIGRINGMFTLGRPQRPASASALAALRREDLHPGFIPIDGLSDARIRVVWNMLMAGDFRGLDQLRGVMRQRNEVGEQATQLNESALAWLREQASAAAELPMSFAHFRTIERVDRWLEQVRELRNERRPLQNLLREWSRDEQIRMELMARQAYQTGREKEYNSNSMTPRFQEAIEVYQQIVERCPGTYYGNLAKAAADRLQDTLNRRAAAGR